MKSFAEIITAKKRIERKSLYSIAPVYIRPPEAEARLKLKKTEA
jgi:hypothetical protein